MELKKALNRNLEALSSLVEQFTAEEYKQELELVYNATIGQHSRHILEFFKCLALGCQTGTVDYEDRERDLQLESDKVNALTVINEIENWIDRVDVEQKIIMQGRFSTREDEIPTMVESTVERELIYNLEHMIHHMAIIKIAVCNYFPHINLTPGMGVAPSTLKYKRESRKNKSNVKL